MSAVTEKTTRRPSQTPIAGNLPAADISGDDVAPVPEPVRTVVGSTLPPVGTRVLFWHRNPAGPSYPMPADVVGHGLGGTLNLNVHEPGFINWAPAIERGAGPIPGCWTPME